MKNIEKFLEYCRLYRNELADLQKDLDENESCLGNDYCCTLAYLGLNYSYELANIGFELGYSGWAFTKDDDFKKVKSDFLMMIMENENILGDYTEKELDKIAKRIENVRENDE